MIDVIQLVVVDDNTMGVVVRIVEMGGDLDKINVVWNSVLDDVEGPLTFDCSNPLNLMNELTHSPNEVDSCIRVNILCLHGRFI